MKQLCSKFRLIAIFFLILSLVSDFSSSCMASKRPPPVPRSGACCQLSFGSGGSGGFRSPSSIHIPSAVIEEPFLFSAVVDSMQAFVDQCHFTEREPSWITARIIDKIRAIYGTYGFLKDIVPEIISGAHLLTNSDVDTIFQEVILPLADECRFYEGVLPPTMPLASTALPLPLGAPLPLTHGSSSHASGGMSHGGVLFSSPGHPLPVSDRFLPVLTPERSVVGQAQQRPNTDIMNSLICHMLYAPETCVDPHLYAFISWLFNPSPDYMQALMINPAARSAPGMQKSFGIFLSQVCGQLAANINAPLIWHSSAPDLVHRVDFIKASTQRASRDPSRPRHYESCEDTWLNTLMGFVDMFVQKDLAVPPRGISTMGAPSSMAPPAPSSFARLAMKILGFYCFQHVQNLPVILKGQFNHSCFVEIYERNNMRTKTDLLQEIKSCRLPAWLLIPFDTENATRVTRRLMIRIHQYRVLLHDNILGSQCEWCRREARSLYTQLHGYVDMLIQTFITGDPIRQGQARLKLRTVFDRINSFVDRLMKLPRCVNLIGRAYEELIFIAKKIAYVLHIPPTEWSFNDCVVVKDDHIRSVVNEREGSGDDGEGGHIFLDPSIRGTFFGAPFRYHLHNSINIKEDAALYENNHVISDFRAVLDDPMTRVVSGDWAMCKKMPGIFPNPGTLDLEDTKRATLFPECYSNHIPSCYHEHTLVCGHEHIFDYCQKLWNIVQAVEQGRVAVGQPDPEGCCLLVRQERPVQDPSLSPGEILTNRMYVFQHPHAYGCAHPLCPLRVSPKPMIVALYAWNKDITVPGFSAPPLLVPMVKIASVYPLMYFDPRLETLPVTTLLPTTPLPAPLPISTPGLLPPAPALTPPPPTATPPLLAQQGLSPDGIVLTCGTERFVLRKHGLWFEKTT